MTTSSFTKSAINYAEKKWIILRNGEQVIECLIESPNIGRWFKKGGDFHKESFLGYFEEHNT